MRVYTYSDARQNFSSILDTAQREGSVLIKRRDGRTFSLQLAKSDASPFDVKGINSEITTTELIDTLREERGRTSRWS
jgi:hypothetical protein